MKPNNYESLGIFNQDYSKYFPFATVSQICLQDCLNEVRLFKKNSFAEGVIGRIWLILKILKSQNINSTDVLDVFDDIIMSYTIENFKKGNYNYMYGAIGGLLYFIEKRDIKKVKELKFILEECSLEYSSAHLFLDVEKTEKMGCKVFNLSLSYGMASLLGLYNIAIVENVEVLYFKDKLEKLVSFYFNILSKNETSFFPNFIINNKPKEYEKRLAWSWGDLGILYQLLVASLTLNEFSKKKIIVNNLIELAKYNFKEASIYDSSICDGASGIAYIFYKIYKITNNTIFLNATNWWIRKANSILVENNNNFHDVIDWKKNNTFMEGMLGVSLVKQTISGEIDSSWDRILLLS